VGAFFGVRQSSQRGKPATTKRTSKRGAQGRARADGRKEAAIGLGLPPTSDRSSAGLTRRLADRETTPPSTLHEFGYRTSPG
jgi:hypothetical protein